MDDYKKGDEVGDELEHQSPKNSLERVHKAVGDYLAQLPPLEHNKSKPKSIILYNTHYKNPKTGETDHYFMGMVLDKHIVMWVDHPDGMDWVYLDFGIATMVAKHILMWGEC